MNALFLTQGLSLAMFYDLMRALGPMDRSGFYVSGREFYGDFLKDHPEIESLPLVKEWEILHRAETGTVRPARLQEIERTLPPGSLWRAVASDRRIALGPLCTLRQDYRSRFSHDRMLRIAEEGLDAITALFDRVKPDVVFSFICVTFGEYLGYLIAQSRGIPFLNIRPTRIDNFITMAPGIFEPSGFVAGEMRRGRGDAAALEEARQYIARARGGVAKYEGVLPVSRKPPRARSLAENTLPRLGRFLQSQWQRTVGPMARENHVPSPLQIFVHRRVLNPARAAYVHQALQGQLVTERDLRGVDYTFFPLHTEPEITLLVHSPMYLNQIEVVRALSGSLPVGQLLVVKEHPASIGKRPLAYYRKLLDIPNVRLADPSLSGTALIRGARLVATIAGSIGFEAALQRVPVMTFGGTPYELLPRSMVRRAGALTDLAADIRDLVEHYRYDEAAMIEYLGATIRCSARINLYSTLLGRAGVHVPGATRSWAEEIGELAALSRRMYQRSVASRADAAAEHTSA